MSKQAGPSAPQINATVMASAGTGKTWLLVSRLLRLLLEGARADAILAITFTRKAAAEMQTRLSERLYELAAADDKQRAQLLRELSVETDAETMARARGLYETLLQSGKNVRTTTFHAFCQEVLRRFPLEADVPPGFELQESSGEIIRAAWDSLLEQVTQQPDSDMAQAMEQLLDYCGSLHGLEQALLSFLNHRGDWWAYTEDQDDPQRFALARLREQLQIDESSPPLTRFFTDTRETQLAQYCERLRQHPIQGNLNRLELLAQAREPDLNLEARFSHCREALLTQKNEPRACKASKTQAEKMGEEGQQQFIELHQQLSSAVIATLDQLAGESTYKSCEAWYYVGEQLLKHYQRIKSERRQLDFTDLEWCAYRLLHRTENAQWVQYKLDQRINHLLVDEFQDTNPTQWRLLQPLLQEMAAGASERQRSIFLVGDPKQSIYRFRRAEPRLFLAAHQWLVNHLDAQGFPLHTSWRSSPAIMQGLNQLFGENGPMRGLLQDFTPHNTHLSDQWGTVTLLPMVKEPYEEEEATQPHLPLRNPLQQPRLIKGDERYAREGEMIAQEIQRLVSAQTPVSIKGTVRPMQYGDVMILVRSRAHVGEYEKALRQAAIPYLGAERGTLLESLEVRDMVALLELLITPNNNLSLAQVLRSPLFSCSNAALQQLAAMDKSHGNWYQRLSALTQHNTDHPLYRARQLLGSWRKHVGKLPIHDLLDRIYNEGNVLARYQAAYPPHLQAQCESNLTRFLELALAIDSGRYPSLGRFLNRLGEMRENSDEAPDEAPTRGSSSRVRLMTIHASKGLEAPVVFLADSARATGSERPFRTLVEWPAEAARPNTLLLIGKKGQQDPFTRQAMEREQAEELREDANLLYVALTRARQHLYLTACAPRRGESLGWYGAMREALDPLKELTLEEPCQLESGYPPALTDDHQHTSDKKEIVIPEALSKTISVPQQHYEIAPSYHGVTPASLPTLNIDEDGRQRGIAIHRMLELITGDRGNAEQILRQVASEQGLKRDDGELNQWSDEVQQLLKEPSLQDLLQPSYGDAFNEVPIIYQQHGRTVHGIIDRLLLKEEEVWVVDYKTHRHATQQNMGELARPYHDQLAYYAEGVSRLWPGKTVRSFLLFTHCGGLVETTRH